jgi:hypothetical protein
LLRVLYRLPVFKTPDLNNPDMQQRLHENIPFNSGCTKRYANNVVYPANIAKVILDEFTLPMHCFWYVVGLFTCFFVLSVRCCTVQRQLLGLGDRLHQENLRNKKGGDVENGACENLTQPLLCPMICRLGWAQSPVAEGGPGQNAVQLLFLRCLFLKSQVLPGSDTYNVTPPENCSSTSWFATVSNKFPGSVKAGCCVSPSKHPAHLTPAFCMIIFCLLSFLNLPSLPVMFLG